MCRHSHLAVIVLTMLTGCSSLYMERLPIQFQVIDAATKQPVQNADAKLVWRVGFGGITWGETVTFLSDSNGEFRITSDTIPHLSETGYPLNKPIRKIMIERLWIDAEGYETLYWDKLRIPRAIEMEKQ